MMLNLNKISNDVQQMLKRVPAYRGSPHVKRVVDLA